MVDTRSFPQPHIMDGNSNSNDNDNAHHDHSRSIANVPAAPDSTTHTIHAAAPLDDPNTATPTTSSAAPNSSPSSSFLVETYSSICTLYRTEHRSRLHWEAEAKQLQLAHKTERLRWEGVEVGLRGDVDRLERRVRRWEREDEARKRRVVEGVRGFLLFVLTLRYHMLISGPLYALYAAASFLFAPGAETEESPPPLPQVALLHTLKNFARPATKRNGASSPKITFYVRNSTFTEPETHTV